MNITLIYYIFHLNQVIVKPPIEIVKETEKCFITRYNRFSKSEIGMPILKSKTSYSYIELIMIDADEATLRERLASWFHDKGIAIIEGG